MKIAIVCLSRVSLSGGFLKHISSLSPLLSDHSSVEAVHVILPDNIDIHIPNVSISFYSPSRSNFLSQITHILDLFSPSVIFVPSSRRFFYKNIPVVNMVRNMEPFQYTFGANPFKECVKNLFRIIDTWLSVLFSSHIIAVSLHVKNTISCLPFVRSQKISVVYHGSDCQGLTDSSSNRPSQIKLHSSFIFTAGSIRPARGLDDLILSLPGVICSFPHIKIVIAGAVDPGMDFYYSRLCQLADSLGVSNHLIWLGKIPSSELSWCLRNCLLFVMTSRAEACPNIVLESLQCGSLAVSTSTPPMPEFFADTALYYSACDPAGLTSSIISAISLPPNDVYKRSQLAIERSTIYSWQTCLEDTLSSFRSAIKSNYTS